MRKIDFWSRPAHIEPVIYFQENGRQFSSRERHRFLRYIMPSEQDLSLLCSCQLICNSRSWTGDYHRRINPGFLTIMLIHSGETLVRHNKDYIAADPGDVVLLHPDADYEVMSEGFCERSAIIIEGTGVSALLEASGLSETICVTPADPSMLGKCLDKLAVMLPESHLPRTRHNISVTCYEIIQLLSEPEISSGLPAELEIAISQISHGYASTLTLEMLAKNSGTSVTNLVRLFRKYLNTTPHRYLIDFRMRHAERLLDEHISSIKEIAQLVGYPNPLNFSTEFRRRHGCSPREWSARNNALGNNQTP